MKGIYIALMALFILAINSAGWFYMWHEASDYLWIMVLNVFPCGWAVGVAIAYVVNYGLFK